MEHLRKVTLDLEKRRLQFESSDARVLRLSLGETGINWEFLNPEGIDVPKIQVEQKSAEIAQTIAQATESEAKKTWTLTGRVKGNVREGRPDGAGKPTRWARVAAHKEDSEDAWMLSTTFHRHAAIVNLHDPESLPTTVRTPNRRLCRPSQVSQLLSAGSTPVRNVPESRSGRLLQPA